MWERTRLTPQLQQSELAAVAPIAPVGRANLFFLKTSLKSLL